MPKQDYYQLGQLTDVTYLILLTLTVPRHGYLIMAKIEEMTNGEVRIGPASLYTTITKIIEAGYITLQNEDSTKKVYCITDKGLEALQIEIEKRERYATYGRQAISEYKNGGTS